MFDFLKGNLIDRPNPQKEFLENRKEALGHVFHSMNRYHERYPNDRTRFGWIKHDVTSPNFEDFVFSCGNKVFPVVVEKADMINGNQIVFGKTDRVELLLNVCDENNLTPCVFPIIRRNGKPFFLGAGSQGVAWNLINPITGKFINPPDEATDELIEISDWELQDWAIKLTMDKLKSDGFEILSYVSMPSVEPHIWFKNRHGNPCWVEVVATKCSSGIGFSMEHFPNQVVSYDGYFSQIDFAADEAHTDNRIYRGRPADFRIIKFEKV